MLSLLDVLACAVKFAFPESGASAFATFAGPFSGLALIAVLGFAPIECHI